MSNVLHKQLASILFWCLALGLFMVPAAAFAFFSDTETAAQQQFQAAELQLDTTLVQSDLALGENQPAASTTLLIDTSAHSVPAAFDIAVSDVGGELDFCDNIQLRADGASVDTQSILGAFTTPEQTVFGAYVLTFSLLDPNVLTIGEVCTATVTITAWQQNMNKANGYRDVTEYQIRLTAADLAVQRLSAPITAESEIAGASVSAPSDPTVPPSKADPAPTSDDTVPPKLPTSDTKESNKSDAALSELEPAQPAGDQETTNESDPILTTDQPEPEPKKGPADAPAESADVPKVTVPPAPTLQPVAPPETETAPEAESATNESAPQPVVEPVSAEEATKEEDQAVTQPAAKQPKPQPESDTENQIRNQPVNKPESSEELEPAKPEVEEAESETE